MSNYLIFILFSPQILALFCFMMEYYVASDFDEMIQIFEVLLCAEKLV